MNAHDMKRYLKYIMELETFLFEQKIAIERLKGQISNRYDAVGHVDKKQHAAYREEGAEPEGIFSGIFVLVAFPFGFGIFGAFVFGFIRLVIHALSGNIISQTFTFFWDGIWWTAIGQGFMGGAVLGLLVAVYFAVAGTVEFFQHKRSRKEEKGNILRMNREIDRENERIEAMNARIDVENARRRDMAAARNEMIKDEIGRINQNMNRTWEILEKAYGLNIIHKKYRHNLSYICSLYEYFDTGRCSALGGHEGGYNLLEQEIKYHVIVDRLDNILYRLDEIHDSQMELYSAVHRANENVSRLTDSVAECAGRIASGMGNMGYSLEQIQYNTEMAARNTEFLKEYVDSWAAEGWSGI